MSYSERDLAKFRKRIYAELKKNPLWVVIANNSRWYCPYCAEEAISRWPKDDAQQIELILKHLVSKCASWREFKGSFRSAKELRRKQLLRELRTRAKLSLVKKKEWQFTNNESRWYCPFCVKQTKVNIPGSRTMNEEMLKGILGHIDGCFDFKKNKGVEQPTDYIQSVVTKDNKKLRVRSDVKEFLEKEKKVWMQRDGKGCWTCPFCFEVLQRVDITSPLFRRENAPRMISDHLVDLCSKYSTNEKARFADDKLNKDDRPPLSSDDDIPVLTSDDKIPLPGKDDTGELLSLDGPKKSKGKKQRRTMTGAWGRDGELAAIDHGMTLQAFENSGEAELISDEDLPNSLLTASREEPEALAGFRQDINQDIQRMEKRGRNKSKRSAHRTINFQRDDPKPIDLRPTIPKLKGYDCGFELCAGSSGARDFMDVFRMGPLFVFALGSVTTKSEDPVKTAYLARSMVRLHVRDTTDPSEILRLVNADIFPQLGPKTFVSACVAILDPRPGRLTYSRAGLFAPMVLKNKARNQVRLQDYEGMVIGADRGGMFNPTVST
ncbi:MAG: SpoIIE family protein phosphatase, partial [Planctomycetota bacterium]|nr:SpoIIE family protein phosphatase [Planctomycetota bacterium]